MSKLTTFPHLTPLEFTLACTSLHTQLINTSLNSTLTHENSTTILSIQKPLPIYDSDQESGTSDTDTEALPTQPSTITYHILLSPTYQVPVLYFQPPSPVSLAEVYELFVTRDSRESLQSVGVVGGISQGEHPVLGTPWYFVHPCNTAEAMREWEGVGVDAVGYLRVWFGLVGGVVGLFLPVEGFGSQ